MLAQLPLFTTLNAIPSPLVLISSIAPPADTSGERVWAYAIFVALVLAILALDLGVFHRHAHAVSMKEATLWSIVWLTLGTLFSGVVYAAYAHHWLGLGLAAPMYNPAALTDPTAPIIVTGTVDGLEAARQYLAGYVVEKSLAMDNIFVIALVFAFFGTPAKYQHRVLFWGIVGALVMRGGLIFLGGEIVNRYQWVLILFGLLLLATAVKMAVVKGNADPSRNPVVGWVKRLYPVTDFYDGEHFFTRRTRPPVYRPDPRTGTPRREPPEPGTLRSSWALTPLFLALVVVEVTDLVFAVDSIPAIFALTPDPFIVFTSNIFAILGLRSLYFCLAAAIAKFRYLKPALILILGFVGAKLLLLSVPPYVDDVGRWLGWDWPALTPIKIGTTASLVVVLGLLALAVVASIARAGGSGAARGRGA